MINYKQQTWADVFHIFFAWKGSLYKSVWIQVAFLTAWGALVANIADAETVEKGLGFPAQAHIIAASAFGFLLVNKSQISYDRFWFGRSVFGALMANIRDFALMYVNFIDAKKEDAALARANAVRYIGGFLALVTQTLHNDADPTASFAEDMDYSFLKDWFTEPEVQQIETYQGCKVALVAGWILSLTEQLRREGYVIHTSQFRLLESKVNSIMQNWARLSTIWSTPIPFPYTQMLQVAMVFYVFTMPFVFVAIMGGNVKRRWGVPAAMLIFGSLYYGLKSTAEELEDPFGDDDNDLPLDALAASVDKDLRAFLTDQRILRGTSVLASQLPARKGVPELRALAAQKKSDVHFFGSDGDRKKGFRTHRTINQLKNKLLEEMQDGPTLLVKVWDEDNITAHDFIGLFRVPFSRLADGDRIDEWFGLEDERGKRVPGTVHASLYYSQSLGNDETQRTGIHKGVIVAHIIEARDLPVMDLNGKSDPFITVQFGSEMKKTKTIRKTLNPTWNESLTFEFHEAHGREEGSENGSLKNIDVDVGRPPKATAPKKSWRDRTAKIAPVSAEPQASASTSADSNKQEMDETQIAVRAITAESPMGIELEGDQASSRSAISTTRVKTTRTNNTAWDVPVQEAADDAPEPPEPVEEVSRRRPSIVEQVVRQKGSRVPFLPPPPRIPSITASPRLLPPSPPSSEPQDLALPQS